MSRRGGWRHQARQTQDPADAGGELSEGGTEGVTMSMFVFFELTKAHHSMRPNSRSHVSSISKVPEAGGAGGGGEQRPLS